MAGRKEGADDGEITQSPGRASTLPDAPYRVPSLWEHARGPLRRRGRLDLRSLRLEGSRLHSRRGITHLGRLH